MLLREGWYLRMIYQDGKVTDINLTYIGGGSRGWAWSFMSDLANESNLSGTIKLYDIDFEAAKNNEIIGNKYTALESTTGKWNYSAVETLEEALEGTDFVIISIMPGTFKEMSSDVHEPEKFGIYQSVGDTAGPGGMMRALRTIPMFVTIAEAIKKVSPDAWVINYTNPMSLCVKTLYHVFPEIKAFGCCHEVFGTQKILASIASQKLGLEKIERKDIQVNVFGINHFTWFDEASYKGKNLFPIWDEFISKNYEEGFQEADKNWANSTFECAHRVKFDLFRRYGYIAAAGDRHLAEFMPGDEYLKNPETVKAWKFGLTTVAWREKELENRLSRSKRLANGEEELSLKASGEEGVLLMKALLGLDRVISNVNIPNFGQVSNIPIGTVVETNAVFSRDSIKPVAVGNIPNNILELLQPHIENHNDILEAALNCDKALVVKVFERDPLVKTSCTGDEVKTLVDTMIQNTKKYLPKGW